MSETYYLRPAIVYPVRYDEIEACIYAADGSFICSTHHDFNDGKDTDNMGHFIADLLAKANNADYHKPQYFDNENTRLCLVMCECGAKSTEKKTYREAWDDWKEKYGESENEK